MTPTQPSQPTPAAAADTVRRIVAAHFIHDANGMFYDYWWGQPGFPLLPTPTEIARRFPNAAGWGTGMENCALNAAQALPGALLRHELAPDATTEAEARALFRGLQRLFEVATDPGFLPRGVGLDGVSHYPNSSADQYTVALYALHAYRRSDLATAAEDAAVRDIWQSVLVRWERDGWQDRREDGEPAWFGEMGRLSSDRAGRLLAALLGGYTVTGDEHWHRVYREKAEEHDGARLDPGLPPAGASLYVYDQNQVAWRLLWELETNPDRRRIYAARLQETAAAVAGRLPRYLDFDAEEHRRRLAASDWEWRRACVPAAEGENRGAGYNARLRALAPVSGYEHEVLQGPFEVAHILALSEDPAHHDLLRQHLPALMVTPPYERVALSWSLYDVEATWWEWVRRR